MTEKRFTMDNPNDWGFPITDNDTGKVYSCASNQLMKDLCDEINKIVKENEQLQERNNRQAKQLDDLYRLIEEKDWRALSDIIDDFKKSDELLQKEWGDYLDEF